MGQKLRDNRKIPAIAVRDVLKGASNLGPEAYTHTPNSQLLVVDRTGTNDDRFGYYLDGEMNWASYDSTAFKDSTYSLDRAGNRTQVYDGSVWKTYTPDALNQYSAAEDAAVTNGPEHEISSAWGANYTYTDDGPLSMVSSAGGASTQFFYDALGRVVKRLVNATQLRYIISAGEQEILEYSSGGITARNVYGKGIDEILTRTDNTNGFTYYYQQDHEGNVTHLTNAAGAIIEKYLYDDFGAPYYYNASGGMIGGSAYANVYLFTGRRLLSWDTYEYRARIYNAYLGRVMSEDPKLFVRDLRLGESPEDWSLERHPDEAEFNLFRYCGNDP